MKEWKCDFCGKDAVSELIVKTKDGENIIGDVCKDCAVLLASTILDIKNMKLKEKYGENAVLINTERKDEK